MSYLCMIANDHGISLAGDSRITFQPRALGLHVSGRKVFALPGRRLVWGCCGLLYFGGVSFPAVVKGVLQNPYMSLTTALRRIGDRVAPATRAYRRLYQKEGSFFLLVGQMTEAGADVRRLRVRDGEVTVERCTLPVMLEGGWYPSRYPERPAVAELGELSVTDMNRLAVRRVQQVIAADKALHQQNHSWRQTVGGNVRCVFEEAVPCN